MSTQTGIANMSSTFEEQFRCCICLDIYRDPVSTPCGHNFCLDCIDGYWDTKDKYECPLCKETFSRRPELRINHGFADIVQYFKRSLLNNKEDVSVEQPQSCLPDEVLCDVCHGEQLAAVKSCLVCQASYCEVHLAPHLRDAALQRHSLTDPATFSTSHLCRKHNKPLEIFCKTDHTPVCASCRDHKHHELVSISRAGKKVKASLKETKGDIKKMIKARIRKVEEIQVSVDASKKITEREIQSSVQVCTMLISAIEQQQAELVEELQRRQKEVERQAEDLQAELQMEINSLQMRYSELLGLEQTQNPLHLLQSLPSLSKLPPTKEWTEVKVYSDNVMGSVTGAISKLMDFCNNKLVSEEMDKLNQYAVDVTLDPDTASGWLELSADGKKVSLSSQKKKTPVTDNSKRFDSCVCVLGKEHFKSGRRYWVVEVGDKTDWDLGLAKESVNRRGSISVRPDSGFWAICRRKGGSLSACTSPSVTLSMKEAPQKVGIFLDYEEGVVSFYDAEAKKHLYTYTGCNFTDSVCPYFNPCVQDNGQNTPLVICPVEERVQEGLRQDLIMRTTV